MLFSFKDELCLHNWNKTGFWFLCPNSYWIDRYTPSLQEKGCCLVSSFYNNMNGRTQEVSLIIQKIDLSLNLFWAFNPLPYPSSLFGLEISWISLSKKSATEGMNICAKGFGAAAFLSWFRVRGAMCKFMENEYRNTEINILKNKPHNYVHIWGNRLIVIFYFFFLRVYNRNVLQKHRVWFFGGIFWNWRKVSLFH